ncbi:MAG: hypothetical protein RL653_1899 [Pseudomonadota bacterium]|jgi:hypothetical protein
MVSSRFASLASAALLCSCGTPEEGTAAGERTLESCTTNVASDVPLFFQKFFKCVTAVSTGSGVKITTESLPPHRSHYYGSASPNYAAFDTSRGSQYRPNPNSIRGQSLSITVPDAPVARGLTVTAALVDGSVGTNANEYGMGAVGVALDSVALFNPLAAPGDDIEDEKYTFDDYNAHPTQDGTYHYHATTKGPLEVLSAVGSGPLEVYGILCDGTVVLGCKELDGSTAAGGLDAQGGHVHDLSDGQGNTYFTARYHVHVCDTGRKYTPEIQYYGTCAR